MKAVLESTERYEYMTMKRIIAVISVIFILLSVFSGCTENEKPEDTTEVKSSVNAESIITLPYSANDTLNPYTCKTNENMNITALVFEPLFSVNSDFTVSPVLAKSCQVTNLLVKVTINTDIRFSDKSLLATADVINSFNKAKESVQYSQALSNFTAATAYDEATVVFTMQKLKPNPSLCLDFPISKESGNELLGTGSYMFKDGNLVVNKNAKDASSVRNKTVKLKELPKGDGLYYSVEVGSISAYYDDLSKGIVTPASAQTVSIATNNLVYLGFNASEGEQLADKAVRRAISLVIDRDSIAKTCFQTQATATTMPFNPLWNSAPEISDESLTPDLQTAEAILKKAGYEKNYMGTYYKGESVLNLSLAVNHKNGFKLAAAQSIVSELKKIGVSVTIIKLENEELTTAISEKKFDLYIGEIKQTNDMSLSPFFTEGNTVSVGIEQNSTVAKTYMDYENDIKTLNDFIKVYNSEMPFASICYRKGILYYTRELANNVNGTYKSVYSNINSWHFNKSY